MGFFQEWTPYRYWNLWIMESGGHQRTSRSNWKCLSVMPGSVLRCSGDYVHPLWVSDHLQEVSEELSVFCGNWYSEVQEIFYGVYMQPLWASESIQVATRGTFLSCPGSQVRLSIIGPALSQNMIAYVWTRWPLSTFGSQCLSFTSWVVKGGFFLHPRGLYVIKISTCR